MGRTENTLSLSIIHIQQKTCNALLKIYKTAMILVSKEYLHGLFPPFSAKRCLDFTVFRHTCSAMGRTKNIPSLSIIHIQQKIYNTHLKIYKNAMILVSNKFTCIAFFCHQGALISEFFRHTCSVMGRTENIPSLSIIHIQQNI